MSSGHIAVARSFPLCASHAVWCRLATSRAEIGCLSGMLTAQNAAYWLPLYVNDRIVVVLGTVSCASERQVKVLRYSEYGRRWVQNNLPGRTAGGR